MRLTHTTRATAMLSRSLLCRVGFDTPGRGLSTSRENHLREGRSSMPTDWNLIRDMMAAVIDSCEQIEAAGYAEEDRDLTVDVSGHSVSIQDFMVSAWTLPENLRYQIIRDRHKKGVDLAYVPEAARIIVRMAEACSELIGAGEAKPADLKARSAIKWYREHAVPHVRRAIESARSAN